MDAMNYLAVRHFHMGCAGISASLFLLRFVWMLQGSEMLRQRWVRVLPHAVDTFLLSSAVALAVLSSSYPFVQPWLTAKVLALCCYIILGTIAIKRGRTKGIRMMAGTAAIFCLIYIVSVAFTKQWMPF